MREIIINKNESNQRIDRFLKKYLSKANKGFIYKMLRKKRIKLNNKRAKPENQIMTDDRIQLYLSDDTIDKFTETFRIKKVNPNIDIIYEDSNIIVMNKERGMLSHSSDSEEKDTLVNHMINYLYDKGIYIPKDEKTFKPAICNRLDRNTSGIVIGAKNYSALKQINRSIRNGKLKKYYICMVKGKTYNDRILDGYIKKKEKNKAEIYENKIKDSKYIKLDINVIGYTQDYSLLKIELITGRFHQIRAQLAYIGHPIVGDFKYGDKGINEMFLKKYSIDSQMLHAIEIELNDLTEGLSYLNHKKFYAPVGNRFKKLIDEMFKGEFTREYSKGRIY